MAGVTHTFVSAQSDDGDTSLVRPSDWNAEHTVPHITFTTTKANLELNSALGFTPATAAPVSSAGTVAGFYQIIIQNKSNGTGSSGDLVITTDTGNDSAEYIDVGINSSGYTGSWGLAKDGYLYVDGGASGVGDLVIGTAQANTYVDIQIGGGASTNRICRFNSIGMEAKDGPVGGSGRTYAQSRGMDNP